jgi:hypothetical protein
MDDRIKRLRVVAVRKHLDRCVACTLLATDDHDPQMSVTRMEKNKVMRRCLEKGLTVSIPCSALGSGFVDASD